MITQPIDANGVATVVAMQDPILRNLWITQSYFDFSARLDALSGGHDRTWCGFAVWASDTAGQSIRRQELPAVLADVLGAGDGHQENIDAVNRRLRHLRFLHVVPLLERVHVVRVFDGALDAVSRHIAHGNVLVYAELAPLFVAFLERLETRPTVSAEEVAAALTTATPSRVEPDVLAAFEWYRRAVVAGDDRARAFAVLAGNVLAVAHEQRRLQADIVDAIDAGLLSGEHVIGELLPRWAPGPVVSAIAAVAGAPMERLLRELWQDAATALLMTLRVPGAMLRLRDPIPVDADGKRFPDALAELVSHPEELAAAAAVFRQWDRTGGTGQHEGARDWAVLVERMNYIVNLFRSRQQDASLADRPFTDDQLATMRAGRVPPGPLLPARRLAPEPGRTPTG